MDDMVYKDCPRGPDGTPKNPHQAKRDRAGRCVYCGVLPVKLHRDGCPEKEAETTPVSGSRDAC